MESGLCAVAGGHPGLVLPFPRGAGGLLGGLRPSHVIPWLCRDAAFLCLAGLVGPSMATSLRGGALFTNEVTRIRVLADYFAHVGLVGPNQTRRVFGLPRPGNVVTITRVKAAHLSGAWLIGTGGAGSRRGGLSRVYVVARLGFGAFRHPIGGLVSPSRAWGLAARTSCGRRDVESGRGIYACIDRHGPLVRVVLARQTLRLAGRAVRVHVVPYVCSHAALPSGAGLVLPELAALLRSRRCLVDVMPRRRVDATGRSRIGLVRSR